MRVTIAAAILGGLVLTQPAAAERVCKQECVGPVCSEKCVESGPSVRIETDHDRTVGRGGRERDGVVIERERRDRERGIELRTPGVNVEIGK